MRKLLLFVAVLGAFAFASPAKAQTDKAEIYLGYTYTRAYFPSSAFGVAGTSTSFAFNGGEVQGQYNFNDYLSFFGYFNGGVTGANSNIGSPSFYDLNYGAGPRLYLSRSRIAPFMELGLGGSRNSVSVTHGVGVSSNAFELLAGGGFDVNLSSRFSVRPVEFDYVMTKFPDGIHNIQSSFRYTGGIIFRFGSK